MVAAHRAQQGEQKAELRPSWLDGGAEAVAMAKQDEANAVDGLVEALEQVERWNGFPGTGKKWPESDEYMSYSACYGSNGERDFMRQLAAKALTAYRDWKGGQ